MNEIVKVCAKHGNLTEEFIYRRKNRPTIECRLCKRESDRKRHRPYEGELALYMRNYSREWRRKNADEINKKVREDRLANPEKYREYDKKFRYKNLEKSRYKDVLKKHKVTHEEYQNLFNANNGLCHICNKKETMINRSKTGPCRLALDHCHATGKIRGLLCHACNRAIGNFKDNIKFLKSAIAYLEKHNH